MEKYIPIQGHPGLVKDTSSGAILNIDNRAYEAHLKLKQKKILESKRLNHLERDISDFKKSVHSELETIKQLLSQLITENKK